MTQPSEMLACSDSFKTIKNTMQLLFLGRAWLQSIWPAGISGQNNSDWTVKFNLMYLSNANRFSAVYSISVYLGSFFSLQLPNNLSLLCNTLIQAWRGGRRWRGGWRRRGRDSWGHPWFVLLTSQLFKLCLQSKQLLDGSIKLVLVPLREQFLLGGGNGSIWWACQWQWNDNDWTSHLCHGNMLDKG